MARRARGSEVSLLRCSRRGHPARTHLSQSRGVREPALTCPTCDLPHVEATRNSTPAESGELFTAERNLRKDIVILRGGFLEAPKREYRDTSTLRDVIHADPEAQVHLRGGRVDPHGSAASTSEARNRQQYARPGVASFDERSHKLALLAVETFAARRLGVEGSNFIDQLAAGDVGEGM